MTSKMIILMAIVTCTVLGELLAIIATAGKEWEKFQSKVNVSGIVKEVLWTYGLWEYCQDSKCGSIKKFYESRKESVRDKLHAARAFMIITIILYGVTFVLLALVHFLKKEIFYKIIVPIFWFTMLSGIIAMSCYTSHVNEANETCSKCPTYSWNYGLGWTSVGIALAGGIISSINLIFSITDTAGLTIHFKKWPPQ